MHVHKYKNHIYGLYLENKGMVSLLDVHIDLQVVMGELVALVYPYHQDTTQWLSASTRVHMLQKYCVSIYVLLCASI